MVRLPPAVAFAAVTVTRDKRTWTHQPFARAHTGRGGKGQRVFSLSRILGGWCTHLTDVHMGEQDDKKHCLWVGGTGEGARPGGGGEGVH